jgi:hypothetical protein
MNRKRKFEKAYTKSLGKIEFAMVVLACFAYIVLVESFLPFQAQPSLNV